MKRRRVREAERGQREREKVTSRQGMLHATVQQAQTGKGRWEGDRTHEPLLLFTGTWRHQQQQR